MVLHLVGLFICLFVCFWYCLDWIMDVFWNVDLAFDLAIHKMLYMRVIKRHILQKTLRMLAYLSHSPIQRGRSDRIVLSHLKIICWYKGKFSDWFILWTFWQKVLQKVSRWWRRNNLNLPSIMDTTNLQQHEIIPSEWALKTGSIELPQQRVKEHYWDSQKRQR